ncbi:aldehyde ferredoxin oxidoreductase family protein [candidate division KSB1 bacterium]|nr:aldehyde ferredoxin oxidoreductase family protein [candidate division KSB1 bacterium]
MYGFAGQMVRINLKTKEITKSPLPEDLAKEWLGARGMVAKILYDEVPRDADPLGPENKLIVAPGVLTGTFTAAGSKCGFGAISPATNGHADASVGGHLGPEIKFAGYDLIVFDEISPEPVFLFIENEKIELRSAKNIWGKGSIDCERQLKDELGEDFEIATIGPAGENGIVFSCITHDFGRNAGRCGVGAVMGSKKIKAIAVKGTKSIPIHDLKSHTEQTEAIIQRTKPHPNMAPWQKYGTALFVGWSNDQGAFPAKNFQSSYYEDWPTIDGEKLVEECVVTDKACFGCWMNCGKYSKAKTKHGDVYIEGPEYETIALIGGSCAMTSIHDVTYANYLCDNLGVDTISGGSVVAFAMECFEKGIITKDDLEGRELNWGSIDDFEYILTKIAYKEGIGKVLAKGTKGAAEELGKDSIKFAMQQKGLESSGYESRWAPSMLLSFMTADIGAHHNRSWSITVDLELGRDVIKEKAPVVIYLQHIRPLYDMISICRLFWGELDVNPEEYVESLNYVTGWNTTEEELMLISEKVWNLTRAHYIQRNGGPGRNHDIPPARYYEEEIPDGPAKGKKLTFEQINIMLDEYYAARGWDNKGNPTVEILQDLGLDHVVEDLKKIGQLGESLPGGIPKVRGHKLKPRAM